MSIIKQYRAGSCGERALKKFAQGQYEEAAELFEKALSFGPKYTNQKFIYTYLGRSYLEMNQIAKAVESLKKAHDLIDNDDHRISKETNEYVNMELSKALRIAWKRKEQEQSDAKI